MLKSLLLAMIVCLGISFPTTNEIGIIEDLGGTTTLSSTPGDIKRFKVDYAGDGDLVVASSDTGVATASLNGSTLTVVGKASGTATITVFASAGTNYTAPSNKTISIKVNNPVSNLAIGSVVKLNENGSPVDYIVVHQGSYDGSASGTWLLRKNVDMVTSFDAAQMNQPYAGSDIERYLNSTYLAKYDRAIQELAMVSLVNDDGNPFQKKIFLLSYLESKNLSYFSGKGDAGRVATGTYANYGWWLRTKYPGITAAQYMVNAGGAWMHSTVTNIHGIRPAMIIPSTASVDSSGYIIP